MRLSNNVAFYLQASIVISFLAGSIAPSPLYGVYQAQWGFSPVTITVVFGIYALAVLSALLVLGSLSDYIGRRPVLIVASLLQAGAMFVFAFAAGVPALLLARVIQGLATGAAVGAVGAGMLDISREKGTVANAVAPMSGTAIGGVVSGLMVQYLPAPTQLVYFVLAAIFALQAALVVVMPESVTRKAGALASMRPQFRLPAALRRPMLLAAPVLIATWALLGLYGSLGPTLVRRLAGGQSHALGGLVLFVIASSGALGVLATLARPARTLMLFGTASLVLGVTLTLLGLGAGSLGGFFAGSAVAGVGFGSAFQGAIRSVIPLARAQDRAGVLSLLYVIAYLAMGLPAVLGGLGVVYGAGLLATTREYGVAVIVLAGAAWLGTLRSRPGVPELRKSVPSLRVVT